MAPIKGAVSHFTHFGKKTQSGNLLFKKPFWAMENIYKKYFYFLNKVESISFIFEDCILFFSSPPSKYTKVG